MIITHLTINNFRNYSGDCEIDFTIDKEHNMILIGGQNGAGKTSMVDAIRLCLYGNRFNGTALSESKYQNYLTSVCNKKSNGTFSISLSICLNEENPPLNINIERKFTKTDGKFVEDLILRKGESQVEFIDHDYWSYYVERIIPPASSRYFFFDGEKVRDVISSDSSKNFMSEAVDNLTGIANLKTLKTDLMELRKRILNKSKPSSSSILDSLKAEMNKISDQIADKQQTMEDNLAFLDQYNSNYSNLAEERSRLIGSTNEKREKIKESLKECTESYDDANRIIADFCYSDLPFFLARSAIARTVTQATDENSNIIYHYSISALEQLKNDERRLSSISGSDPSIKALIESIIKEFNSNIRICENTLEIPLSKIEVLKDSVPSDDSIKQFMEEVRGREYYSHEINELNKKISKLTDDSLKELDNLMAEVKTEIEVMNRQMDIDQVQLVTLQNKQSAIASDIAREERLMVLKDVDKASIKNIGLIIDNIDRRITILQDSARSTMEKKINEIYHVLKNTKDMVKSLRLTDGFEIQLLDFEDKKVDINYISEGEKGILMYAAVFALHAISDANFPIIVDSPLGRMDSMHVHNLAQKYFPSIPSQIILLSHDREITGESLDLLKDYISKTYTVRKFEKPKIIEGYFE